MSEEVNEKNKFLSDTIDQAVVYMAVCGVLSLVFILADYAFIAFVLCMAAFAAFFAIFYIDEMRTEDWR